VRNGDAGEGLAVAHPPVEGAHASSAPLTPARPPAAATLRPRPPLCAPSPSRSPANVNILNGNAEDLQAECDAYEARIAALGGVELFLGGIGPDGHIAFSEWRVVVAAGWV
jgi:hypothetical protein